MILTTKITLDSKAKNTTTTLDKYFQFIIIEKLDENKCKVIIYNAISFRNSDKNCSLIIDFYNEKNSRISNVEFTDHKRFYEKTNILNQFWGSKSKFSVGLSEIITEFIDPMDPTINKEIQATLESIGSNGVFGVSENSKSIPSFIINPAEAQFTDNQAKLKCHFSQNKETFDEYLSNGYWFKSEFEIDLNTGPNGFNIKSKLEFSDNSKFLSPDFKIYMQTGKKYDLRSSKITVISEGQDHIGEIVKVFSQSKIKYFIEWAEHGIYTSSLFKVNPGTTAELAINQIGLKSILMSSELEDLELPRKREINLLIFSIIFSLFASFGFDKTRQSLPAFKNLFPQNNYLSIDSSWLIVCIGILIFYYSVKSFEWKIYYKLVAIAPIFIWFFSYLTLNGSIWGNSLLTGDIGISISHFLYTSNIFFIMSLLVGCILYKVTEPKGFFKRIRIKVKKIIEVIKED